MQQTTRLLSTIALIFSLLLAAQPAFASSSSGRRAGADRPATSVLGATEQETEMVEWALGRFAAAGMELPAVKVGFFTDYEDCLGFIGYFRTSTRTVFMCNRGGEERVPEHTLIHELGHAWADHNLEAADREAFMELRGVEFWNTGGSGAASPAWWQRGYEHAAEIIAWGLAETPFHSMWLHTELCTDLASAFTALTGIEPLNDSTSFCKCQEAGSPYKQACPAD
ncbi:MAG: hypothetical protein QNJ77_02745 [Acidimicrobiia bacterium]|nr:hypothetical protein [Acidimicrobiia bacterium]